MTTCDAPRTSRRARRRWVALVTALGVAVAACGGGDDPEVSDVVDGDRSIELRDEAGPSVDAPDREMAMTVDAVETHGADILVRLRVENRDDGYLDLGVQDTIYGPLLVMRDDRGNVYDGRAEEPAGIPGRRVADLSFRLDGPIEPDAEAFTLELATQRGPIASPSAALPDGDGVRWRVDDRADGDGSAPTFADAPRLPDLIDFWLETRPLPER